MRVHPGYSQYYGKYKGSTYYTCHVRKDTLETILPILERMRLHPTIMIEELLIQLKTTEAENKVHLYHQRVEEMKGKLSTEVEFKNEKAEKSLRCITNELETHVRSVNKADIEIPPYKLSNFRDEYILVKGDGVIREMDAVL